MADVCAFCLVYEVHSVASLLSFGNSLFDRVVQAIDKHLYEPAHLWVYLCRTKTPKYSIGVDDIGVFDDHNVTVFSFFGHFYVQVGQSLPKIIGSHRFKGAPDNLLLCRTAVVHTSLQQL